MENINILVYSIYIDERWDSNDNPVYVYVAGPYSH